MQQTASVIGGPSAIARGRRIPAMIHRGLNGMFLVLVPVQFYAAGLAAFGAAEFTMHASVGWSMIGLAIVSAVVAAFARRGTAQRGAVVAALAVLQPVLAFAPRASAPAISALHAVNALALLGLALIIERRLAAAQRG